MKKLTLLTLPLALILPSNVFTHPAVAAPPTSVCLSLQLTDTLTATSSIDGNDCLVIFTSGSGTWTSPSGLRGAKLLIIGGGGGGGAASDSAGAGGGGAGLVISNNNFSLSSSSRYTISVGSAGSGGTSSPTGTRATAGINGGDSLFSDSGGALLLRAFGGIGGMHSRAPQADAIAKGNSGVDGQGGYAATLTSAAQGGMRKGYNAGAGGGGNTSNGANSGGNQPTSGGAGGSGAVSTIVNGSSVSYGVGGSGGGIPSTNGTAVIATGGTNYGDGGGGAGSGGSFQGPGGNGASGVLILRYRLPSEFTNFAMSLGQTTAVYRRESTITATVTVDAKVTFKLDGVRIPNCISLRTTGSGSSYTASCIWKPAKRGTVAITATTTPLAPGIHADTQNAIRIGISQRSTLR